MARWEFEGEERWLILEDAFFELLVSYFLAGVPLRWEYWCRPMEPECYRAVRWITLGVTPG